MPTPSPRTPALLGTQLLFNVGFYAVVPFLALVLTDDFGVTATAAGLVLGVRTFAQQGMFLFGGVLADRFGARSVILIGCAVRILGFATLALSLLPAIALLALFVVGVVLTGLGGALFSPGLNVLIADAETRRGGAGARVSLFAWLSVAGELGAVVGPLVGVMLLGWSFVVVAFAGAAFFLVIAVFLIWALPRQEVRSASASRGSGWGSVRDRRFVAFSALHAADLLAYNQLYLSLPLQLARVPDAVATTAVMFAGVSVLTLTLQLPVARWSAYVGAARALRIGYAVSAAGFTVVGAGVVLPLGDLAHIATVYVAAALIVTGHMIVNPTALSLVPRFAGSLSTGSFFGLLATCGGIAVLVGNVVAGGLLAGSGDTAAAWIFLLLPLAVASVTVPFLLPVSGNAAQDSQAVAAADEPVAGEPHR